MSSRKILPQVLRRYVDINLKQLMRQSKSKTLNMQAVMSSFIVLYITEEYDLDLSLAFEDILCHFLSPKPTGEWLQTFTILQKIHFSHDILSRFDLLAL